MIFNGIQYKNRDISPNATFSGILVIQAYYHWAIILSNTYLYLLSLTHLIFLNLKWNCPSTGIRFVYNGPSKEKKAQQYISFLYRTKNEEKVNIIEYNYQKLTDKMFSF